MGNSAYIRLVEASTTDHLTLQDVKDKLQRYIEMTTKTGQQLGWDYADAAFPYTMTDVPEGKDQWFYLKGKDSRLYKYIVIGVDAEKLPDTEGEQHAYIQVVLPEGSTPGDKSKANEFCKYLAKAFKAKLELFNGRTMYYYPRKP